MFVLELSVMDVARSNAKIILQNTTACPFKFIEDNIVCVYCCDKLATGSDLLTHVAADHPNANVRIAFAHVGPGHLKVEITDLKCRHCDQQFQTLDDVAEHLVNVHEEEIDLETFLGLIPFKICDGKLQCANCDKRETTLRALSRHTLRHFSKFSCQSCDKSFALPNALRQHVRQAHSFTFKKLQCRSCKQEFAFSEDLKEHYLENKTCCRYRCRICGDRFLSNSVKITHMQEMHGCVRKEFKCNECAMTFDCQYKLRVHFVTEHTEDYFQCSYCYNKFHTQAALERHLVFHTREKKFPCSVCGKSFFRNSSLTLHMWIHSDVKRFRCEICDLQFNQKVVWKSHVSKFHPELLPEIEEH